MSLSWFFIILLIGGGLRLGWPELTMWIQKFRRRHRWIGSLELKQGAVKLYEDPRDRDRFQRQLPDENPLARTINAYHKRIKAQREVSISIPTLDARLSSIAQMIAEALTRGQPTPSASLVCTLSASFGSSAPIPFILHQKQHPREEFGAFLVHYDELLKQASTLKAPQLNLGLAMHTSGDELMCVGLLQPRYLTLNPFARHIVGDIGVIIHGECIEMMPLEAWLTDAEGRAHQVPLKRNGSYFSIQLKPRVRGVYRIEIVAESAQGPTVCLNVPIYRSIAPPTELILTADRAPSRFNFLNRYRLRKLVNESRRRNGSASLPRSHALDRIAQSYAAEMATQGFVSHTSPQGQRLKQRAQTLEGQADHVFENLASGSSIEEIHDQLMLSPIHRAAILDSEMTHLGIGISINQGVVYGVELFSHMNRPLRITEDRIEISRRVQRARREEGLVRLPHETSLDEVAQRIAIALVQGECQPQEVNQHAHHLLNRETSPAQLEALALQVSHTDHLPAQDLWFQSQVKSFGVGLAQGKSHEPCWVVFIFRLSESIPSHPLRSRELQGSTHQPPQAMERS